MVDAGKVLHTKRNRESFLPQVERALHLWFCEMRSKPHAPPIKCIVRSNFRRKEPLYLFIQALFVSGTYTGFRDLLFSLLFPAKNISSTMMRQKVR